MIMTEVIQPFTWGKMTLESRETIKRSGLVFIFGSLQPNDTLIYLAKYHGDEKKGKRSGDWGFLSETAKDSQVDGYFQRETMQEAMRRCLAHELGLSEGRFPPLFVNRRFFLDFSFSDVGGRLSLARSCVFWVKNPADLPIGSIDSQEISEARYFPVELILNGANPLQLREVPSTLKILKELGSRGFLEHSSSSPVRWFNLYQQ